MVMPMNLHMLYSQAPCGKESEVYNCHDECVNGRCMQECDFGCPRCIDSLGPIDKILVEYMLSPEDFGGFHKEDEEIAINELSKLIDLTPLYILNQPVSIADPVYFAYESERILPKDHISEPDDVRIIATVGDTVVLTVLSVVYMQHNIDKLFRNTPRFDYSKSISRILNVLGSNGYILQDFAKQLLSKHALRCAGQSP